MRALCLALIASTTVLMCGCPAPTPGPLGAPYTVFVPPPGVVEGVSIEQGGETLFEVGTAAVHYEIHMNGSFSGESMTLALPDLPTGVFLPMSTVESLARPFNLAVGDVQNGFFTIWADGTTVPGVYTVTLTVPGTVSPGSTAESQSDTFTLTITPRP